MIRVSISVEGPTEAEFAKEVLTAHLRSHGVEAQPVLLGRGRGSGEGGGNLKHPLKFYKMANILLYSLCSSSSAANSSINGRNRCVGQLGICSYSMSPCRNNE